MTTEVVHVAPPNLLDEHPKSVADVVRVHVRYGDLLTVYGDPIFFVHRTTPVIHWRGSSTRFIGKGRRHEQDIEFGAVLLWVVDHFDVTTLEMEYPDALPGFMVVDQQPTWFTGFVNGADILRHAFLLLTGLPVLGYQGF